MKFRKIKDTEGTAEVRGRHSSTTSKWGEGFDRLSMSVSVTL